MPLHYANSYVLNNSYDFDTGIGKLFVNHNGMTYALEEDEELPFSGDGKTRTYKLNKPTAEFQLEILRSRKYNLELYSEEQKRLHNDAYK